MAFRRLDIPKTTRKGEDGELRRIYPRFAKDRSLLPKVELAIGYLDGMVGRRRESLSPDAILDLFGDPKLARCMLACLADAYRYRTRPISEVVGEDAALALAAWDLLTPADVRGHVYRAANERRSGFVAPADRSDFLAEIAEPLGLPVEQVEELLYLDAERNALLVRVGPKPAAEDVLARYNLTLALSVLRHASEIVLELPELDRATLETVCGRHELPWKRLGTNEVRLAGRRNALGSWGSFGVRVARCAVQLLMLSERTPGGRATIHVNGEPLTFALSGFAAALARPEARAAADAAGVILAASLSGEVAGLRRTTSVGTNGWTMRRATEPIVVADAVVLPEWLFVRGEDAVALAPVPTGHGRDEALRALEVVQRARPTIALGAVGGANVPALIQPDAFALVALLDEIAERRIGSLTQLGVLVDEVRADGWIGLDRLNEMLEPDADLEERLRPVLLEGEAAFVPGFGLCRVALLDELLDRLQAGPLDVADVRGLVADRIGGGAKADALTLHLLARHAVVPGSVAGAAPALEAA